MTAPYGPPPGWQPIGPPPSPYLYPPTSPPPSAPQPSHHRADGAVLPLGIAGIVLPLLALFIISPSDGMEGMGILSWPLLAPFLDDFSPGTPLTRALTLIGPLLASGAMLLATQRIKRARIQQVTVPGSINTGLITGVIGLSITFSGVALLALLYGMVLLVGA